MLSKDKNILELLGLLRAHGITELVLCPGSRNAGIVHSALQIPQFNCHPVTDERSAGFVAIGLALATGRPSVVIVTSGSALANLYPAACEALYQQVPIIFVSADRPAEWIGQMDGQTMVQQGALGNIYSISLPQQHDADTLWHSNRIINQAILECTHHGNKPVHINIPIHEPIYDFTVEQLPAVRVINRVDINNLPQIVGKVLILVGQRPAGDSGTIFPKASVIAENISNLPVDTYTNSYIVDWNRMGDIDILITMGGHLTCKDMKEHFRKNPPRQHWHVSEDGAIADLFCCQTLTVEATFGDFIDRIPQNLEAVDIPTRPVVPSAVLTRLLNDIPANANIHLANSTTIRMAQLSQYQSDKNLSFLCNRGINGIEGSLSAAVGYAMATPQDPMFVIIGDLSFFYDQNALWNVYLPSNLHILLVNNNGGKIFDTLPLPSDEKTHLYVKAKHNISAKAVAQQYGIRYLTGEENINEFIDSGESVILEIQHF